MIYQNLTELVGRTPLLNLQRMASLHGALAQVVAKVEAFNPGGSVKDRVALHMIEDAEARGQLRPGCVIIEPTSGNTGVGLAWISRVKGYEAIIVMPDSMSVERQSLLRASGARLVLTPGAQGMKGAISEAERLCSETPGAVILGQFTNPANAEAHELATGEEIWQDTDGQVDIFVAGVGTGGTLTGTARTLKKHNPQIRIVAVEPADSAVLSGGKAGAHGLQGIGAGFIPEILDTNLIDEVIRVTDEEAYLAGRQLSATEGLLTGISSGAAVHAAIQLALRPENKGKRIVVLLPDTGERYLSTKLFMSE
ncbi:MAG: cysteine synthase A [Bacteroidaceae bacterium]|nr:cysteine synthase A [Bacteroidaceae bacterium]